MSDAKTVSESRTEQVHILMPEHINGNRRLFGGRLVEWIDVVAAVAARRHAGCDVTTVAIDNLQFRAPAHVNDTILLVGQLTYVGHTSMEVRVDTFVEALNGEKTMINRAYLVMVALDRNERPTPVPRLICESDGERAEWESGVRRNALRRARLTEQY